MKARSETVLSVMNVLAWVAFIGLLVKAGAILTSYIVSVGNAAAAKDLYRGLDIYLLRQVSFWHYSGVVSLLITLELLKAYTAYLVIRALSKIKMSNPFTAEVSKLLECISYYIVATWGIAMIYNGYIQMLAKKIDNGLRELAVSDEFILLAGVVLVFAQIFRKGVELQSENELTV